MAAPTCGARWTCCPAAPCGSRRSSRSGARCPRCARRWTSPPRARRSKWRWSRRRMTEERAIPERMRVARLYGWGDVRIEEMPVPRPGRGEALVRIEACGVCGTDALVWYGEDRKGACRERVERAVGGGLTRETRAA